ncbi:MAG TPA: copper chaperone PCu(A)C [Burkholderiales bacterium]|nr:copper chaperone PCu(A)C [Burkholderiales bacterium]
MRYAILLLCLVTGSALAQVRVEEPWARATAPGAKVGAGYMKITSATADRLIGASSPAAARVEMHVTSKQGDVMRMREVKGYDIPAGGSFELAPSGAHLMLVDLKAPLKQGTKVPLTLRFQKAGEVKVELQVRALGASGHQMH